MRFLPKQPWQWIVLIAIGIPLLYVYAGWPTVDPSTVYGITWSKPYAEQFGLNSEEGLRVTMSDLGVKQIRLPAYWPLIEAERGTYDFDWLDRHVDIIESNGGKIVLAVGSRLPRWPECWVPDWAEALDAADRERVQLAYLQAVYERYANRESIAAWQVENEARLHVFARCDGLTEEIVEKELAYVRQQETARGDGKRPVITTDSGELSTWLSFAGQADEKGVSAYRVVTSPFLGIIRYWFVPSWAYQRKAWLVQPFVGPVHVSEFQMEPWSNAPLHRLSDADLFVTFDINQMRRNLRYAERMHMPKVYFWGAEWWLWMKEVRNHPEFWEEMKVFFASHRT